MPHPVDIQVGATLRFLRKASKISQSGLASKLGLTFQQVQKYERGTNRMSASKLYEAAEILGVPVARFFEGLSGTGVEEETLTDTNLKTDLQRLICAFESVTTEKRGWLVQTAEIAMGSPIGR